jgi:hypothetical protein
MDSNDTRSDAGTEERPATSIGLLILRVGIGGYLLTHGRGKLQMLLSGVTTSSGTPSAWAPF